MIVRMGRQSRWFVAELIVIVVGVLVALGIDEWRENLDNAALEKQYLSQLINDLASTAQHLAKDSSENAPSEKAANELLAGFEEKDRLDLEDVRQLLTDMQPLVGTVPQLSTAESMVTAGDLRLVRDPIIRAQISQYISFARDEWLVPLYQREEQHRLLSFRIRVIAQSYGISPSHWKGRANRAIGPNSGTDVDAFFGDAEAYAYVAAFTENRAIMSSYYSERLAVEAKTLRESLETYLSSR
jgi:hypothetical protein